MTDRSFAADPIQLAAQPASGRRPEFTLRSFARREPFDS